MQAATTLQHPNPIAGEPEGSFRRWQFLVAVAIGNALEWFDYIVYGYFAVILAGLFFPARDPAVSLLLAFAGFGLTYVMRPLGAVILGRYADTKGRVAALQLSIVLMMGASLAIAVLPTYDTIGITAPVIVILARFAQSFSVGGEFGSATALFAEKDPQRRGFYASWQFAGQGLAGILATGFGAAITSLLSDDHIRTWGWRIPFLFGVIIGPFGFYLRRRVSEAPEFEAAQGPPASFRTFIFRARMPLLVSIGLVVFGTVATYTAVFLPTYATRHLSLPMTDSFVAGVLTGTVVLILTPLFGAWSDRIGRTAVPMGAALVMLVGTYPALAWLAANPTTSGLLWLQGLFGAVAAAYLGSVPALMAELFPPAMRSRGLGLSYAVGVAIFGGSAPLIHEWLIGVTGNVLSPGFYLIAAALVSLAALLGARRLGHR